MSRVFVYRGPATPEAECSWLVRSIEEHGLFFRGMCLIGEVNLFWREHAAYDDGVLTDTNVRGCSCYCFVVNRTPLDSDVMRKIVWPLMTHPTARMFVIPERPVYTFMEGTLPGSLPITRFLRRDGDNAIMVRVDQFLRMDDFVLE